MQHTKTAIAALTAADTAVHPDPILLLHYLLLLLLLFSTAAALFYCCCLHAMLYLSSSPNPAFAPSQWHVVPTYLCATIPDAIAFPASATALHPHNTTAAQLPAAAAAAVSSRQQHAL
jgi:hypothetical protein